MLRDIRRLAVPELDVFHEQVDVRTPSLRVGTQHGKNVASDFALVQRAAPFLHHLQRPQLVVMLEGRGRFDEGGERHWLEPGTLALSDASRAGTDAFGGATCRWLVLDWDPSAVGAPFSARVAIDAIGRRDVARLDEASRGLAGPRPALVIDRILDILRALGIGFARVTARDVEDPVEDAESEPVLAAFSAQLSNLDAYPAITEIVASLGTNARQVNRRIGAIARRYRFPWAHWRAALHHTRMLQALRLLAAPGATTEMVARLTGFRAPTALCHAFDKGGLPSPGALARAARQGALDGWADYADAPSRAVA